ncbi:MAG: diguanylate cyclase, partial [Candidatus Electrothrix sp. AR5]|nr:diguanylate cyclase [Candidatus Electrothrix sp. AR5]
MSPISGLVSIYGVEISRAGRIACDEINASGGVLGRPLELIIVDDGSLPETAVPAAKSLIDDHACHAIIGNLLSNSRIAVADLVATPRQIPYLNFSFYEGSILSRYFFHFAALPNQQIDKMIPYMAAHHGPKMFFSGSNYEWPRGSIDAAKKSLLRHGGEIVGEEYLPIGSSNIDMLLGLVSKSGADVFVPYFAGTDQINLLTRFTELGLKKKMAVVMGHYDEIMVSNLSPDVRSGFYSSNTYFMSIDTPQNNSYCKKMASLQGVTGVWPRGNGMLTNFGEGTYLCVKAFAKAVEQAGSLEPENLVDALETIEVCGPQGPVVMDPETHHAAVNSYLSRCNKDGTFTIIEKFGRISPEIPERYSYKPKGNHERQTEHNEVKAQQKSPGLKVRRGEQVSRFKAGIFIIDKTGRILYVNNTACSLVGVTDVRLLLNEVIDTFIIESDLLWQQVKSLQKQWYGILSMKNGNGTFMEMQVTLDHYFNASHGQVSYILTCIPQETIFTCEIDRKIISQVDIAIIASNEDGIIIQANRHSYELFGYSENELIGTSVHLLLPPNFRENHKKHLKRFLGSDLTESSMGKRPEIAGYRKDGSLFPAEATISKFQGKSGWILVAVLRDITSRKKEEKKLLWRATHDPLTCLPNRQLVRERMDNALHRSKRSGENVAILFFDLDNFKLINDSYGHDAGDQLLLTVAKRLSDNVRPGDTVARFGGDEFVVLCEQVTDPHDISSLAMRINDSLRAPVLLAGHENFLTSSIGIAVGHGTTHSSEDLFRDADSAMYHAKDQGKDGWKFYNQG